MPSPAMFVHNGCHTVVAQTDDLRCLALNFLSKRNLHLSLRLQWLSRMVVKLWLNKLTICVI